MLLICDMRNYFYSFCLLYLCTFVCNAQKQYTFDHWLTYTRTFYKDSIKIEHRPFYTKDSTTTVIYLTNANDNSYHAVVTPKGSLHYRLQFKDENGLTFDVNLLKTELEQATKINIPCEFVSSYRNHFAFMTKHYAFSKVRDTLIDDKTQRWYSFSATNKRRQKRSKSGTMIYRVAPETEFHLPVFDYAVAFLDWQLAPKQIPNGIFAEKLFVDYYDHIDQRDVLVSFHKIDKSIRIDAACDYTQENSKSN